MPIMIGGDPSPTTGTGDWVRATSPTLVTPVLGVAAGTSLALGGATIGSNALAVTGTASISGPITLDGGASIQNSNGYAALSNVNGGNGVAFVGYASTPAVGGYAILNGARFNVVSSNVIGWSSSSSNATSTADTGLSRISAGVIGVGTGAQGSTAGSLLATNYAIVTNSGQLTFGAGYDLILTRPAAATLQHGAADAASPVAQTIKFQDVVAGTSNTAGVNATIQAPAGTGTGAGGSLIFQVAPAGSTGSAKNAWATALTIDSTKLATFTNSVTLTSGNFYIPATGAYVWNGRSVLTSPATGVIVATNGSQTDLTRFVFGTNDTSGVSLTKSTTTIQAKLGDGSAFTNIQGKLTTDTAYVAGDPTTTGYLVVYDSTGTAYRVPALAN